MEHSSTSSSAAAGSSAASSWFALEIDRDFYFNTYGEGKPRLYFNPERYVVIKSAAYDHTDNILTVTDSKGETHILSSEPDHELFKDSIFKDWQIFDERTFCKGSDMEDRCDYEPWMFNSLQSLAYELRVYDEFKGQMYFGKGIQVE